MKTFKRKKTVPSGRQRQYGELSKAPTAFSYHHRRADERLNTGRQLQRDEIAIATKHSKSARLQRLQLLGLVLIVIAASGALLNLSGSPRIVILGTATNKYFLQNEEIYQSAAQKLLTRSFWNKNKLTVDSARVSSQLESQFPELSLADMTVPVLTNQPVLYLEPAQPALILSSSNGSFVISENGRALQNSASVDNISRFNLPTVVDQSATPVELDHQTLSSADITFIHTVLAQLTAKSVAYTTITLPAASRELDVQIAGKPYHVKFNLESGDAQQQVGTFLAISQHLAGESITPSQYIDVRVDGRAYYL